MISQFIDTLDNPLVVSIFNLNDRKVIVSAFLKARKTASEEMRQKIDAAIKKLTETPIDETSLQVKVFRNVAKRMFVKQVKTMKKVLPKQLKSIPAAELENFVSDAEMFLQFSWFSDDDRKEIMEIISNERNNRNTGITNYL